MTDIFSFNSYKAYADARMKSLPKQGRGEIGRIARELRVHPSLASQILKGDKDFTPEQAEAVARYWGLLESETEYWMLLILKSRAGTKTLQHYYDKQLHKLQQEAKRLDSRIKADTELSEQDKAEFYSSWIYSLSRLASSIPEHQSIEALAQLTKKSREETKAVVEFLLRTGLCKMEAGRVVMGPQTTYLGQDSVYLPRHHFNWRMHSIQRVQNIKKEEMMFTAPISLDEATFAKVRQTLSATIQSVIQTVQSSESKILGYVGVDLLKVE